MGHVRRPPLTDLGVMPSRYRLLLPTQPFRLVPRNRRDLFLTWPRTGDRGTILEGSLSMRSRGPGARN